MASSASTLNFDQLALPTSERRPRPVAIGRPLASYTWAHEDPSFPKLREIVEVVDPELSLLDRKVWNVILHYSYDGLYQDPNQLFSAPAAEIRRSVGWDQHRSNREIEHSLERLQRSLVSIGYYANNKLRHRKINLLVMTDVPREEGVVYWRFAPDLAPLIANPQHYSRIHLRVISQCSSGYSLRLYELLSLYVNRKVPVWEVPVEELRDLLGATAKSFANWAQLSRKALQPALKEINSYADFSVDHEPVRAPRSRKVATVIFRVQRREEPAISNRKSVRRRGRDPETPDFEDGKTDIERGSAEPITIGGLEARLGATTRAALRTKYPQLNIDLLIEEWARWSVSKGGKVIHPKAAFEAWLRTTHGAELASTNSDSAPAPTLTSEERRACSAVGGLNVMQRQPWLNIARNKVPDLVGSVPNLSPQYFHMWVPQIMDELRRARVI